VPHRRAIRRVAEVMKLADEWRSAWRWLQTWLIAALSIAPLLYDQLATLQDVLPPTWFKTGMAVLGILTLINNVRKKA
jgi:hypothetical protein